VIAGLFVLSACAVSSTAQGTLPRVEPTRDSACVRAELPRFEALVPSPAAPGTYRVCGHLRHGPCGTLTVVG
jgi:hypothetical protein